VSGEDDWAEAEINPIAMDIINTKVTPNKIDFECLKLLMATISNFSLFIYYELPYHQNIKRLTLNPMLLFGNIVIF
jgi:hypothetical protein